MQGTNFEQTVVLHPALKSASSLNRTAEARLIEAEGLSLAIGLKIVHKEILKLQEIKPATYLGSGQVEKLSHFIADNEVKLVIVDAALSPIQQRNLEREWNAKVIDRTGLILEIFGERARTKEGQLQVELAALTYQRSRLVRSWTHLERQRGGAGFLGGPGESQLEIDRRLIDERVQRIKQDLEEVRRTRNLHRAARKRVPYPIVALVGYTNAGKSTLFNRLTKASVMAKDLLFATLDPTMRRVTLPSGKEIILSDTVGFISDLPTELIAAFRATLEEVTGANLLLHVRDMAHPDNAAQKFDVERVLKDLKLDISNQSDTTAIIEVWNKIDLLEEYLNHKIEGDVPHCAISAQTGKGVTDLLHLIDRQLSLQHQTMTFCLDHDEGRYLAWLYRHGEVLSREDREEGTEVTVRLSASDVTHFTGLRERNIG